MATYKKRDAALQELADVALEAVAHVGAANYREREKEAERWIEEKLAELLGRRIAGHAQE